MCTINFYDERNTRTNSIIITQDYLGLDTRNSIQDLFVNTQIEGTLPEVDADAQVVFKDYKQEYTQYGKGTFYFTI